MEQSRSDQWRERASDYRGQAKQATDSTIWRSLLGLALHCDHIAEQIESLKTVTCVPMDASEPGKGQGMFSR